MTPGPEDFTSYVDSSPFSVLFDKESKVKTFDVLMSKPHQKLSERDIAKLAGMDRSSIYRALPELVDSGLVNKYVDETDTSLYQLNREHPTADAFLDLQHELTKVAHEIVEPSEDLPIDVNDPDPTSPSASELREEVDY